MKTLLPTFAFALLVAGCGDDPEPTPTITQGVWGLLIAGCDTPGCDSHPIANATVAAEPLMGTAGPGGSSKTDEDGMYQITLSPGQYHLSQPGSPVAETDVTVGTGLVKCTWISGPGGGNWMCQ